MSGVVLIWYGFTLWRGCGDVSFVGARPGEIKLGKVWCNRGVGKVWVLLYGKGRAWYAMKRSGDAWRGQV